MVMRYMLDTDICIALIKNRPETMLHRLKGLSVEEVGISGIVAAGLWFGVAHSRKKRQNQSALKDFLAYVTLLNWPGEAAALYGRVRAQLQKKGTPIGAMDLLIGTHALFLDTVLVTNNTREYKRIPDLKIENWLKE